MPPRPVIRDRQTSRPLSAVYIGKGSSHHTGSFTSNVSASPSLQDLSQSASAYSSLIDGTPPSIPDLPEPPSPSSSVGSGSVSGKSGLPSPPATNSTGSGSTAGDTNAKRGEGEVSPLQLRVRGPERGGERPVSLHSNGTSSTSTSGEYRGAATPMRRSSVSFSSRDDDAGGGGPSRSRSRSRSSSRQGHMEDDVQQAQGDFDDDYADDTRNENHNNNLNHNYSSRNDADDDDIDHDDDNDSNFDGDDTARLDRRLEKEMGRKSENVLALQKVRSLTHRNQLALDKLSRLSPSPASRSSNSNSNLPPNSRSPAPSTTSSSRHSSSASNHNRQLRPPPQELARSGSETERESTTHSHSSAYDHSPSISSSYLSTTPPPATPSHHRHHTTSSSSSSSAAYRRVRQTSAPDSPSKARRMVALDDASSSNSNVLTRSPSGMRRHRASLASVSQLQLADFSEEEDGLDQDPTRAHSDQSGGMRTATNTARDRERTRDRTLSERDMIIQSALAAAATSRRSPLGSRRRAALPKEFRSDLAGGAEDSPSPNMNATANTGSVRRGLGGTVAGARRRDRERDRDSPEDDRRDNWKREIEPMTPLRSTAGSASNNNNNGITRSSTLRDPRVRYSGGAGSSSGHHSTPSGRWSSEEWRSPSGTGTLRDRDTNVTTSSSSSRGVYRNSLSNEDGSPDKSNLNLNLKPERRQSLRGGSAESALMWSPGGRSLLGEGLRAAGLSRRRGEEDGGSPLKGGSGAGAGASNLSTADLFREREKRVDWSPQDVLDDRKRRGLERNQLQYQQQQQHHQHHQQQVQQQPTRAATSMAHYQYLDHSTRSRERDDVDDDDDDNPMLERELVLHRSHRSAYSLAAPRDLPPESSTSTSSLRRAERESLHNYDRDRAASALSRYDVLTSSTKGGEMPSPALRASHLLDRDRDRIGTGTSSPFGSTRRYTQPPASNLNASTSSAASHTTTATASGNAPEHTRLMMESLAMFENQVNKLPRLGPGGVGGGTGNGAGVGIGIGIGMPGLGTGATQAELTRNAQNVVFAAERLLLMLKHGSARAVEASVEAEVDLAASTSSSRDTSASASASASASGAAQVRSSPAIPGTPSSGNVNPGEIWTKVAAEYREGSRTADELVRGVTALLLGFGRVVKEFGVHMGGSEFGSPSVHGRTMSLGDDAVNDAGDGDREVGRKREDGRGEGSGSGRRSVASSSRRSWEATPLREREREREPRGDKESNREDALRRLVGGGGGARSESVLARASPATFQRLRDRAERERDMSPLPPAPLDSSRRLFTPREQRDQPQSQPRPGSGSGERRGTPRMSTQDSKETIHAVAAAAVEGASGSRTQRYSDTNVTVNVNANAHSREYRYEPSPTPASRTHRTPPPADRERTKTLTPLTIPRPLPVLPSEKQTTRRPGTAHAALGGASASGSASATTPSTASSALPSNERSDSSSGLVNSTTNSSTGPGHGLSRSGTTRDRADRAAERAEREKERERRRATVTSRAVFPSSSSLTMPMPTPTTATSSRATHAQVTFSRPSANVSATATLSEMQEKERVRTSSTASVSNAQANGAVHSPVDRLSRSNSESKEGVTTRERRKTLGRVSLDGVRDEGHQQRQLQQQEIKGGVTIARNSTVHAADRSAATTILQQQAAPPMAAAGGRRERRRTVTDIWPDS